MNKQVQTKPIIITAYSMQWIQAHGTPFLSSSYLVCKEITSTQGKEASRQVHTFIGKYGKKKSYFC